MKRVWRVAAALGIAVCMVATSGRAEADAAQRGLAKDLLAAMNVQKSMEQTLATVKQMQMSQLQQMGLGKGSEQEQATMRQIMDLIANELGWTKLEGDLVAIYAETYTAEELKGLLAFYQSPLGRKSVAKEPELMRRTMEVVQGRMQTLMPKIRALVEGESTGTREAAGRKEP